MINFLKSNLSKQIVLASVILVIPFLEFININFHKIDFIVYKQLSIYFVIVSLFFYIIIFSYYYISKKKEKTEIISLVLSFSFWILFKFEFLRSLFSFFNNYERKYFFLQSLSAFILLVLIIIFFFFFLKKNYKNTILLKFFSYFMIIQFVIISLSIIFLINKNYFFLKKDNNFSLNQENFYTLKEIEQIKKNKSNKNIYFVIMDGMASFEQYQKLLKKNEIFTGDIEKTIDKTKVFFKNKNFKYIENSFSTFRDTHHTIGSILNLNPLDIAHLNKTSIKYQSMLYPSVLSKNNFEIKKYPNLINNLYKINYTFKWVGYKLDCRFVNPDLCYKNNNDQIKKEKFLINFYILKSFLINTPALDTYSFLRENLNLRFNLPDRNIIETNEFSDLNSRNEVLSDFIENIDSFKNPKKSYFFLIHNLLPTDPFIFTKDCGKKNHVNEKDIKLVASNYNQNYLCALKKIKEFISFINSYDPTAIVIFQSDHGIKMNNENIIDKHKIFNLIKVPKTCKKHLSNKIDSVNAVRLAISCATDSEVKLLKRNIYSE